MTDTAGKYFYRYYVVREPSGVMLTSLGSPPKFRLICAKLPVQKRTPAGAYIRGEDGRDHFCLSGAGKRYAHDTKAAALESFIKRKTKQRIIVKAQLALAEAGLELAVEEGKSL